MLDRLFSTSPETSSKFNPTRKLRKGVIIGAGRVGMACAYSMLIQNTFDDLTIVGTDLEKVEGEVMDLVHGLPFVAPSIVRSGTIADGAEADIVIITAGAKQESGESRLDLVQKNVEVFQKLIPDIVKYCPQAILIVVTNPVDIMSYVSWKLSGLPSSRIIGSGTVLDTARFRYLLAQEVELDAQSVHAYIVGEHGDTEVPIWSKANIAGMNLRKTEAADSPKDSQLEEVFEKVKNAAYEIIERKGATCYAIGLAVTHIVEAILANQNRILTVSTLIDDICGLKDVYLSLPAVVSRQGVTRILRIDMSAEEQEKLQESSKVLREIIDGIKLL